MWKRVGVLVAGLVLVACDEDFRQAGQTLVVDPNDGARYPTSDGAFTHRAGLCRRVNGKPLECANDGDCITEEFGVLGVCDPVNHVCVRLCDAWNEVYITDAESCGESNPCTPYPTPGRCVSEDLSVDGQFCWQQGDCRGLGSCTVECDEERVCEPSGE